MTTELTTRKSGRSKKSTTFFTVPNRSSRLEDIHEEDDEEHTSDDEPENEEKDNHGQEESDNDDDEELILDKGNRKQGAEKKSRQVKSTSKPKATKAKKIPEATTEVSLPDDITGMSLFVTLKKFDQVGQKKTEKNQSAINVIKKLADEWIKDFRRNRISAIVNIVNFILLCSGASKEWIEDDIDLDALEPDELDELLKDMIKELTTISTSETSSEGGAIYPLVESSGKKSHTNRSSIRHVYIQFWESLADRLLDDMYVPAASDSDLKQSAVQRGRGSAFDVLNVVIDQLISLSSMPIVNIRDAVTEALGTIGRRIVISTHTVNQQQVIVSRQLDAEAKKSSKQSSKHQSFTKQKDTYMKVIADMTKLSQLIFNSIFVHRFKDSHDSVRIVCLGRLTDWMVEDPLHYYDDEYLKYICGMIYDSSSQVRKEALICLGKLVDNEKANDEKNSANVMGNLRLVVEHFLDRFIEIAAGDIDDEVSMEMFILLRKFQVKGFLDHVGEELDFVDQIVFDPKASLRTRYEALLFVMTHTEGFEVLDDDVAIDSMNEDHQKEKPKSSKKASRRGSSSPSTSSDAGSIRKRHAFQLETLAEFAEYHLLKGASKIHDLSSILEKADMLADVCLMIPNFKSLFDWSVITTLLMKESDGTITTTLRDPLVAIVLRLFVRSVICLRNYIMKSHQPHTHIPFTSVSNTSMISSSSTGTHRFMHSVDDSVISQTTAVGHKSSSSTQKKPPSSQIAFSLSSKDLTSAWESLVEHLLVMMPKLLLRFRDNTDNLRILSSIIDCCRYSSSHAQEFSVLLKTIEDLLSNTSYEPLVEKLCNTLSSWLDDAEGGTFKGSVLHVIEHLHDSVVSKFFVNVAIMKAGGQAADDHSKKATSRGRSKKRGSDELAREDVTVGDAITSCSVAITKMKYLWKYCDCRSFLSKHETYSDVHVLVDDLIDAADALLSSDSSKSTSDMTIDTIITSAAARDCAHIIQLLLIWYTRSVYTIANALKSSSTAHDDASYPELQSTIGTILSIREKQLDMLSTWMTPGSSSETHDGMTSEAISSSQRFIQREAFQLIGDLRALYPLALADFYDVDALALTIPQDILSKMRFVFDYEGRLILDEITKASKEEQDVLSMKLIHSALRPLSTAMYYDPEHLNRRQASAVMMYYLMEPLNDRVVEFIRLFSKRFKDQDMIRYMEIQLVTLKGYYQDSISNILQYRINRHNGKAMDGDDHDDEEDEARLQDSLSKFQFLSKKLSSGLGVGKVKDEQSITALNNFIRACIDFSFSEDHHLVFLSAVGHYLKFLPATYTRDIINHFQNQMRYRDLEEIESWPEELSIVHQSVASFQSQLTNTSSKGKQVRVAGPVTAAKPRPRKRAKSSNESLSMSRLSDTSQSGAGRRLPSILETLDEHEGSEDDEHEDTDDELDFDGRLASKKAKKQSSSVKAPQQAKKPAAGKKLASKPASTSRAAAPSISNRPSRKAAEKSKSYYDGYDDEHGDSEEDGDEEDNITTNNNNNSRTTKPATTSNQSNQAKKSASSDVRLGLMVEDDEDEDDDGYPTASPQELSPIKKRNSSTGTIKSIASSTRVPPAAKGSRKRSIVEEELDGEDSDDDDHSEDQDEDEDMDLDMILAVPIRQRLR